MIEGNEKTRVWEGWEGGKLDSTRSTLVELRRGSHSV